MNLIKIIGISIIRFSAKIFWVLFVTSCLTPIDFETENIGGRLVVSGQISPIQDQNKIQLGLTADTKRLPLPLTGANITLFNDTGMAYPYIEDSENQGTYILTNIIGVPTATYYIQIIVPTGEVYKSIPEKMPESVGTISTRYDFLQEEYIDLEGVILNQYFAKIYLNSILPTSSNPLYLKWSIEEAFILSPTDFPDPFGDIPPPCFIVQNADPQRIALFNGDDLKTTSIENLLIGSRIVDWTFLEKHYFTTYQSSLTKDAYEYWRKVNILANQVGSIFDTPPAEITGNIYNVNNPSEKVLGFFQASNQVIDRFYILPTNIPFPLLFKACSYDPIRF